MKAVIVIDVEMCTVREEDQCREYPFRHEIIQIGAVMMDEAYEITGEFSSYVCPEYGKIDPFIQELTGICEEDIKEAPPLEAVLESMLSWLEGREAAFYSWSIADYKQISREIRAKGMDTEVMAFFLAREHWVDYQKAAGKRLGKPWRISLGDALKLAGVQPEGKLHDGLSDARNTARLIAEMEKRAGNEVE